MKQKFALRLIRVYETNFLRHPTKDERTPNIPPSNDHTLKNCTHVRKGGWAMSNFLLYLPPRNLSMLQNSETKCNFYDF